MPKEKVVRSNDMIRVRINAQRRLKLEAYAFEMGKSMSEVLTEFIDDLPQPKITEKDTLAKMLLLSEEEAKKKLAQLRKLKAKLAEA